jgi:hypothetical protein
MATIFHSFVFVRRFKFTKNKSNFLFLNLSENKKYTSQNSFLHFFVSVKRELQNRFGLKINSAIKPDIILTHILHLLDCQIDFGNVYFKRLIKSAFPPEILVATLRINLFLKLIQAIKFSIFYA